MLAALRTAALRRAAAPALSRSLRATAAKLAEPGASAPTLKFSFMLPNQAIYADTVVESVVLPGIEGEFGVDLEASSRIIICVQYKLAGLAKTVQSKSVRACWHTDGRASGLGGGGRVRVGAPLAPRAAVAMSRRTQRRSHPRGTLS